MVYQKEEMFIKFESDCHEGYFEVLVFQIDLEIEIGK